MAIEASEAPIAVDSVTHMVYAPVGNALHVYDGATYELVAITRLIPSFDDSRVTAIALDQRTGFLSVTNDGGSLTTINAYR